MAVDQPVFAYAVMAVPAELLDSILLLVDAAEGPLPQTRYVLSKAFARDLPVVVAVNKIDRTDARPAEVLDAIYELFIDLGATADQLDFPVLYTNAKLGTATTDLAVPGSSLKPLFQALVDITPAPTYQPDHPAIQAVATGDAARFYAAELALRERFGSPPFGRLVKLMVGLPDRDAAEREAGAMADELRQRAHERGARVTVIGPAPAYIARRADRWRWNVVLRGDDPASLLEGGLEPPWSVDVDPESLL